MITTLSFDLDDTLWDPRPALMAADKAQWQTLSERYPHLEQRFTRDVIFGCRKQLLSDKPAIIGDVTALRLEVMYRLLVELAVDPLEAQEAAEAAFSAFMSKRNHVDLFADTSSVLDTLAKSYTLVAITNGNADVFQTDIGPYFDLAIRADEVGIAKPARGIFDLTWKKIGCCASEVIHIGDSVENDVQGAINAGVIPIWYNPEGSINQLGVSEVRGLSELPTLIDNLIKKY
jgi:HAD superfamily hydrolase (TIGR01549 family)